MSVKDLADRMEGLLAGMTPGQWTVVRGQKFVAVRAVEQGCYVWSNYATWPDSQDSEERWHRDAVAMVKMRDALPTLIAKVRELEALREKFAEADARAEYFAGYEADLVSIRRALDEVDAPHDPEDAASLEPKRIRLLAEKLDDLHEKFAAVVDAHERDMIAIWRALGFTQEPPASAEDVVREVERLRQAVEERDRLRNLFDDAGQGEHNVLGLVEHYQREAMKVEEKIQRVIDLLYQHGCDCDCEHDGEGHFDDCERCFACRVDQAIRE